MDRLSRALTMLATLTVAVLLLTNTAKALDQMCTRGFLDPIDKDDTMQSQLVTLFGQYDQDYGFEQIIFPSLGFSCSGTLTNWVFRGSGTEASMCRVQVTTWRFAIDTLNFFRVYERVSTTDGNTLQINVVGSLFNYELRTPVQVQRGDIVGFEIAERCALFDVKNNVFGLNVSSVNGSQSALSYRRSGSGSQFYLQSSDVNHKQGYQPLIKAVMGVPNEPTTDIVFSTSPSESVDLQQTTTEPDLHSRGGYEEGTTASQTADEVTTDEDIVEEVSTVDRGVEELLTESPRVILPVVFGISSLVLLLLAVLGVSTSVMCARVRMRAKVQVCSDCSNTMENFVVEVGHDTDNQGTLLQQNTAYNKFQTRVQTNNKLLEEDMQTNGLYGTQFEASYEDINYDSEAYESVSVYSGSDDYRPNYSELSEANTIHTPQRSENEFKCGQRKTSMEDKQAEIRADACEMWSRGERDTGEADYRESGVYDKIDRKSEAYDTIDYRYCTPMKMSKNVAYVYSSHDLTEDVAQAVRVVKSPQVIQEQLRDSYGDEQYYENVL